MTTFTREKLSSGIPSLDKLMGGGLDCGSSNLFLGPAGTGKSTLAIQYALAAAERGAIFAFEESLHTLLLRTSALGMNLEKHIKAGTLHVQKIDPAQLSPGEFANEGPTSAGSRAMPTRPAHRARHRRLVGSLPDRTGAGQLTLERDSLLRR